MDKYGLFLFIFALILTAGFFVSVVNLIADHITKKRKAKVAENNPKPKKGDILIYNYDEENPFKDNEWNYDLITETRTNKNGDVYYISKKCNIDGILAPRGAFGNNDNDSGLPFNENLYTIVNHIDL